MPSRTIKFGYAMAIVGVVTVVVLLTLFANTMFRLDREAYLHRRQVVAERCEARLGFARSRTDTILVANGGCWEFVSLRMK